MKMNSIFGFQKVIGLFLLIMFFIAGCSKTEEETILPDDCISADVDPTTLTENFNSIDFVTPAPNSVFYGTENIDFTWDPQDQNFVFRFEIKMDSDSNGFYESKYLYFPKQGEKTYKLKANSFIDGKYRFILEGWNCLMYDPETIVDFEIRSNEDNIPFVKFNPAFNLMRPDSVVGIDVRLEHVYNIVAGELELEFDPSVLEYISMGPSTSSTFPNNLEIMVISPGGTVTPNQTGKLAFGFGLFLKSNYEDSTYYSGLTGKADLITIAFRTKEDVGDVSTELAFSDVYLKQIDSTNVDNYNRVYLDNNNTGISTITVTGSLSLDGTN